MYINKKKLGNIEKVYATACAKLDNENIFLAASEGEGRCCAYKGNDYSEVEIWDEPGGTMNIVPIPGKNGEFLATQKFLPVFDAKECTLNYIKYNNGKWIVKPIMNFPYLHRFDLLNINNEIIFIGATLCSGKDFQQDWSKPGAVYVGKISKNYERPFEVKKVIDGITKNHGFCYVKLDNKKGYLITGVEGVFFITIPKKFEDKWEYEQILTHEVSDIAVSDIDNDGELELGVIEPFHGNKFVIYKKKITWEPIFEYEIEFGHVVWGGNILNTQSFIVGYRRGKKELVLITKDKEANKMVIKKIDDGVGPSQISVLSEKNKTLILSANREINEVAIYELKNKLEN